MVNPSIVDVYSIETSSFDGDFSIATFDSQRIYVDIARAIDIAIDIDIDIDIYIYIEREREIDRYIYIDR